MNKYYVYLHKLKDTDIVFYVGKGSGNRAFNLHLRSKYHKNIVKKYGCSIEVIKTGLTQDQAFALEIELIKYYKSINQAKVNLTLGGEGCLGRNISAQTRSKIANSLTGFKHSIATLEKMKKSKLGKPSGMLGKSHKLETNLKRAEAIRNNPNKGRKAIICVNTGKIYKSLSEACLDLNLISSNLSKVLKGKRLSINGLEFKYVS